MPDVNQFGHVLGFGRKSTKPSYFQRNDGRKELFLWEKRICGVPRNVPMISEPGAPWEGMGKRELGSESWGTNLLTAKADAAQRAGRRSDKFGQYTRSTHASHLEKRGILADNLASEVHETVTMQARPISTPMLYPFTLTHADGLVLDKKVMARQRLYKEPDADGWARKFPTPVEPPYRKVSQFQYRPYERTHHDFPRPASSRPRDDVRWQNSGSQPRAGWSRGNGVGGGRPATRMGSAGAGMLGGRPETAASQALTARSNASVSSITSLKGILT